MYMVNKLSLINQINTAVPVMIRHSFLFKRSVNSLEIIISGQMRKRISSCTHP